MVVRRVGLIFGNYERDTGPDILWKRLVGSGSPLLGCYGAKEIRTPNLDIRVFLREHLGA